MTVHEMFDTCEMIDIHELLICDDNLDILEIVMRCLLRENEHVACRLLCLANITMCTLCGHVFSMDIAFQWIG